MIKKLRPAPTPVVLHKNKDQGKLVGKEFSSTEILPEYCLKLMCAISLDYLWCVNITMTSPLKSMVHTWTRKMRIFLKSGNFEQTGKVREFTQV